MAWPTPQDYNEAVQNYTTTFADPDLRLGSPAETPLGLPRPISGMFASVYKFQAFHKTWAVRCFLREIADLQERYRAISRHLGHVKVPYMVDFDYLQQGIRIRGQWYPILKMEWVDGVTLSNYIETQLNQRDHLLDLAQQWLSMTNSLRAAQIGHGDLQHGNVMVVQGRLRLVDYDGMYVPSLYGYLSHEVGHRNYQHPRRTAHHFSLDIDNFSSWVVYMSLLALSVEPQLWQRFRGGDECILMRYQDFIEPQNSQVLKALTASTDPQLQTIADFFCSLLSLDPLVIPSPSDFLNPRSISVNNSVRSASWFEDHIGSGSEAKQSTQVVVSATVSDNSSISTAQFSSDLSWILDSLFSQVKNVKPTQFERNVRVERVILFISLLTLLLAVGMWAFVMTNIIYVTLSVSTLVLQRKVERSSLW